MAMPALKVLFADLVMDAGILAVAQLSLGRLKLKRLLAAICVLQLASCIYFLFGSSARHPLVVIPPAIAAAYIISPTKRILSVLSAAGCILVASGASAGFINAFGNARLIIAAVPALAIILLLLRRRMNIKYRWNIEVAVENDGKTVYFEALIDTGNRLHEPLSGLPVMIVSERFLPPDLFKNAQMRRLAFGVLGSSGEVQAFRADSVIIRQNGGRWLAAPECYIAVFCGRFPGSSLALAPPEFTEVMEPLYPTKQNVLFRRNDHAVF